MATREEDLAALRSACVRVKGTERSGSGYFVAPDLVVTCEHVIRPAKLGAKVSLTLVDDSNLEALIERVDSSADVALLRLPAGIPGVTPLRLKEGVERNRPFEAYGFPRLMRDNRLLLTGTVHDPVGRDSRGASAIVLSSDMVAAGAGAQVHGYSGGAVMVEGVVVGHLRRVLVDEAAVRPSAEMGLLFATPARDVLRLLHGDAEPVAAMGSPQPPGAAYSPQWYLPRLSQERAALMHLGSPGSPAVLQGPRQTGKTWLLTHLVNRWRQEQPHSRVVRVNLLEFDDALKDLSSMTRQLAQAVVDNLEGDAAWLDTFDRGQASPMIRLGSMLKRHILKDSSLLLAMDDTDAVLSHPHASDFLGGLRAWMGRASEPPWHQLRLLMAISSTPAEVIVKKHQSPFNIVPRVELGLLGLEEVSELTRRHGLRLTPRELQALCELTGGHPYLARRVLFEMIVKEVSDISRLLDPASEVFDAHMLALWHFVQRESLGERLAALLRDPAAAVRPDEEDLLKKAGLVRRQTAGRLEPTCTLYRDYFMRVL